MNETRARAIADAVWGSDDSSGPVRAARYNATLNTARASDPRWFEIGVLMAEPQGSFAPEQLWEESTTPDVFSRSWTDGVHIVTVEAAPCIIGEPDNVTGFEIVMCTEVRDVGDEGGDSSEYEWDHDITYMLIREYDEARTRALNLIKNLRPEYDLADPRGPEPIADLGIDPADYPGASDHLKD